MRLRRHAKNLRQHQSDVEKALWRWLCNRQVLNCKFRRQHIIDHYIVDFVCLEIKLIIELDGGQHADQIDYDGRRTTYLESKGYEVKRYWNNDVALQFESVLEDIYRAIVRRQS